MLCLAREINTTLEQEHRLLGGKGNRMYVRPSITHSSVIIPPYCTLNIVRIEKMLTYPEIPRNVQVYRAMDFKSILSYLLKLSTV